MFESLTHPVATPRAHPAALSPIHGELHRTRGICYHSCRRSDLELRRCAGMDAGEREAKAKGPMYPRRTPARTALRCALISLVLSLLSACGGGGNPTKSTSSTVSMSVSPRSLSVSATTTQSAPSTAFTVYVNGLSLNQVVYLNTPFSGQGISQVINHGGNLPAYVPVALDPPANLGPGTYVGVVHVSVCIDQACTQLAANSPEDVQVTYTVTRSTFATVGLSPSSAYAGSQGFTLAVNGATFTPQSSVLWDGTAIHSTYVNSNQLVADVPAGQIATAGTATVTVYDPTNGTSNAQSFTIKPSPIAITSLSPVSPAAGGPAFTLTVTGTGFTSQSSVLWNGASLATTFVSATKLSAPVPASDITTPGTDAVAVADPVFGVSDSKTLTVVPAPLALSSVSPKTVTVGGPAFTLTAIGSSFTGTSVVQWNGVALTTTVVSSTVLTAQVPAGDVGAVGTASEGCLTQTPPRLRPRARR